MSDPYNLRSLDIEQVRARSGAKWQYDPAGYAAWVADMDFPIAPAIRDRLIEVASTDVGYPAWSRGVSPAAAAFVDRMAGRYGWNPQPSWLYEMNDVIQGVRVAVHHLTGPGDGVVLHTPAYHPFLDTIASMGRRIVRVPSPFDHDALDSALAREPARLMILCHPHNPTGHVFTRAELERIAEIAVRHDLFVISDEVHADLVFPGHTHIPIASLGPEIAARTLTLMSATKAFNIAGLRCAVAIFGSESLKTRFRALPAHIRGGINSFGLGASEVAWTQAQPWLDEVMAYLDGNRAIVADFVKQRLPGIRHVTPEATYLAWLDCRALALPEDPFTFFLERGRVALSDGRKTGQGGEGHVRLNFATSRPILQQILERLEKSLARG